MAGDEAEVLPIGVATTEPMEASALLVRMNDKTAANNLGLLEEYQNLKDINSHDLGEISAETVSKLYGRTINLSASQVDKLADCRLAYFLNR